MLNLFGVKVKPAGLYTHVTGVSFQAIERDISKYYSTSLITKYFVIRESWDTFKIHDFFLPELEFILNDLLALKTLRSRRRELKELQMLLETETWLKDAKTPHGKPFDFKRLDVFRTRPDQAQRQFLETYPLIKDSYRLKGLLLDAKAGSGKAMPLWTRVKVPGGWKKISELNVGDSVIGPEGNVAIITGVFNQGVTENYKFYFEDGRVAESHPLHLWDVTESLPGETPCLDQRFITTTQDIINNFALYEYSIPLVGKIDGLTPSDAFDPEGWVDRLLKEGTPFDESILELSYNDRFSIVKAFIRSADNHLADGQLFLMLDTENDAIHFQRILWSLGGICYFEKVGEVFKASVRHRDLHELAEGGIPTIASSVLDLKDEPELRLKLVKIEKQPSVETMCISIDSADNLFIVDHWVVTHNTFTSIAWSRLINDAPTMVVHPMSIGYEVWIKQLEEHYITQPKIWSSSDNKPLAAGYDYYLIHYDYLRGNQFEQLQRWMTQTVEKTGVQFKLILDESHNFNEIAAKQTQRLIQLSDNNLFSDALPMSGTPLKAQGSEVFTTMCLIDKYFDGRARQFFMGTYGKNRASMIDMLNHRIGRSKFTIPEIQGMGDPDPFEIVKVKVPNADKYTLDAIRLEMQTYIVERINFYNTHMKEFKLFYDETVNRYRQSVLKQPALLVEVDKYIAVVNRFRQNGYDNFRDSADSQFCKKVEEKIEVNLKGKNLSDFRSIKSAVKYLGLKIRGEALGNVLGKARINAIKDMVQCANLPQYIDNVEKKTLIFTSYVEALKITEETLKDEGYTPLVVYGETNHERDVRVAQFAADPKINPLVATYSSLKEGYPLIMANQIISLDAPWRDFEIKQVQARVWRRGQDSPCFFIMLDMDTGSKVNITTRSINILEWSREQVDLLLNKTAGHQILDRVTGQEMMDVSDEPTAVRIKPTLSALSAFV